MNRSTGDIIDELLVLGARAGLEADLARLIERWDARLVRHAAHLLGDANAGADAAQEAWLKIVKRIGTLRDPSRFGPWAVRITTNICRDAQRRERRERRGVSGAAGVDPDLVAAEAAGGRADEIGRLRVALGRLPGEQRALLSLRYTDRLGLAEIARVLGVPVGTVKSRLHTVRAELRSSLGGPDDRATETERK